MSLVQPPSEADAITSKSGLADGDQRIKVIYVMGTARSGSTIFGVTLGNCENIFYAGELGGWLVKSGISWLGGSERARFWSIVRENVREAEELFGKEAQNTLEKSLSLFRVRKWATRRQLRARYRRLLEDLYLAIAHAARVTQIVDTASHTYIVDTSSHPLRARQLQQLDRIDLYLIFLVREPQSVIASFTTPPAQFSKSRLVTNAYIWFTNMLSVFVFLRHPRDRRLFVRYEDFIADPRSTLRHILRIVDAPPALPDLSRLRTGIPFQGNRPVLRSEEVFALGGPTDPPRSTFLMGLLQFPWTVLLPRLRPVVETGLDESIAEGEAGHPEPTRTRNSEGSTPT